MCGIFAWWASNTDPTNLTRSSQALQALHDRGPDAQHLWHDNGVYLGHARLKITGDNGEQPIWNADKSIAILVNGQFYDHECHREKLLRKGYHFSTDTDVEILIGLYQEYGLDCIHMLEGEFAFVLWDRKRAVVWAARDRAGVKPLRYIHNNNELVFASEAKAFLNAGWDTKWNQQSLAQALSIQYHSPDSTMFDGIEQLAQGQMIVFTQTEQGWLAEKRQWWTWFSEEATDHDDGFVLQKYLHRAVARRVNTPWNVAVHLSGGCDSTSILRHALLARRDGIEAYCVGFEQVSDIAHDESYLARRTAHILNTPLHVVGVSRMDMLEYWGKAMHRTEQFGVNGHVVAKYLLNKRIHEHGLRVSVSGEGADEALLGYPFLRAEHASDPSISQNNQVSVGLMLPDDHQLDLSGISNVWGFLPVWLQAKGSLGWKLHQLLDDDWVQAHTAKALEQFAHTNIPTAQHKVHQAAQSWARIALGGYILPALADAPESGFHIQGRIPFLDSEFLQHMMRWNADKVLNHNESKHQLREFLRSQQLGHVAQRHKHPFQAPPLLSSEQVRAHLLQLWSDPQTWHNTPIDPNKMRMWMQQWKQYDVKQYQLWEPVVSTLLSVYHLNQQYFS